MTSATLHLVSRYRFLTTAGATRCGLDESRSGPLSEKAKLRACALLLFCCLADKPRHRLTTNELSQQFSVLHRPGIPGTYYFDPNGKGCIGLARIDAGHHGRWDRGTVRAIWAGRHLCSSDVCKINQVYSAALKQFNDWL